MKARFRFLILVTIGSALSGPAYSQFPPEQEPNTTLVEDEANNQARLIWQSYAGWTYFIQHSLDLQDWTYLNIIEPGDGTIKEWSYQMPFGDNFFLRLHATTQTGDPFTGDFDSDGLSNADEVAQGLNPLKADADGDGMSDGYEMANGLNPLIDDGFSDLDGDGRANITEYLANTNPQAPEVQPLAAGLMVFTPLE